MGIMNVNKWAVSGGSECGIGCDPKKKWTNERTAGRNRSERKELVKSDSKEVTTS